MRSTASTTTTTGWATTTAPCSRGPEETRDDRILAELHRLETAQAHFLLDHFGDVKPDDRLMDAGSGRGATSFMANNRFGCEVDGVTISEYQVEFANDQAVKRGVSDQVRFHFRNMLDTGSRPARGAPSGRTRPRCTWICSSCSASSPASWRSAAATSASPAAPTTSWAAREAVAQIDEHYTCNIHPRSEYFKALAANDLVPIAVTTSRPMTIPYWELREHSSPATGVEEPFLESYCEGSFQYLLIVADRV